MVWLKSQPLAVRTREAYAAVIIAFAAWLEDRDGGGLDGPRARDLAARDYKRSLKVERGLGPASVNQALAALDHFFRFLGLGAAIVQREELPRSAPRALTVEEQRLLLRAAEESSARDRAIVGLLLFAGLRLSEAAALQLADVRMSARKGVVVVRSGKGDAYREVPLNALVRRLLEEWLEARRGASRDRCSGCDRVPGVAERRVADEALGQPRVARRAGLEISAHALRHSFVTGLVRAGHDPVLVAELEFLTGAQRAEWERFPAEIDERALARCFSFPDDELERIAERKGVHARFGLAATVGSLRWIGFVPIALSDLPERAAALIAEQLDVALDEIDHGRLQPERHARGGQLAAGLAIAGFRGWHSDDAGRRRGWLCERALDHDGPLGLLRDALDRLRRDRIVRPGLTVVERLVAAAREDAEREIHARARPLLTVALAERFDEFVRVPDGEGVAPVKAFGQETRSVGSTWA